MPLRLLFLLLFLLGQQLLPAQSLHFLVLGDWGRRGEPNQLEVAKQMARVAQETKPQFVISTGDNFYDKGVLSVEDSHWKESFEAVYSDPSLQVPWYAVLGNHDHLGNIQAQIDYSKTSKRWRMPAPYFRESFAVAPGCQLEVFFLDTQRLRAKSTKAEQQNQISEQLRWLEKGLGASKAQWKLVVGHHPVYSGGEHGNEVELLETLLPLLRKYNVNAYFNGHDHNLQHLVDGKLQFFCSGAGSQIRETRAIEETRFCKSVPGFMSAEVTTSQMEVAVIDKEGNEIYSVTLPK